MYGIWFQGEKKDEKEKKEKKDKKKPPTSIVSSNLCPVSCLPLLRSQCL